MRYTKVEENVVASVYPANPGWLHDDGTPLTDQEYIEDHQVYPVVDNDGYGTIYYDKDIAEWTVGATDVTPSYYTLTGTPPASTLGLYYVENDVSEWTVTGDLIQPTYTVKSRNDQEMEDITNNVEVVESNDTGISPKPKNDWLMPGQYVAVTYYELIPDPERANYIKELYIIEPTDPATWTVTGNTTQEVCVFTPKTDISDIQGGLLSKSATMRYDIEVNGMWFDLDTVNVLIDTDRFSQTRMSDKYVYYTTESTPNEEWLTWKTTSGRLRMTVETFKVMSVKLYDLIDDLYEAETGYSSTIESAESFNELEYLAGTMIDAYSSIGGINLENLGG
jgi:hypothetical protein